MGIATGAAGPSALTVPRLDLEPRLQDDGGAGGGAPAQGPEKVLRPDQAALVDLVLPIPCQQLDPSPEARLVVAPGPSRVLRIVDALATDVAALDDASEFTGLAYQAAAGMYQSFTRAAERLADQSARALETVRRLLTAGAVRDGVLIPWQGWALCRDDFLLTRMLEIVVHAGDLALSAGVRTPEFPAEVFAPVRDLLVRLAVKRHGQSAVISALARSERTQTISAF